MLAGEIVNVVVTEPLFIQVYVFAPLAVSIILPPAHTALGPLMANTGTVFTVTAKLAVLPVQPSELDPVRV